MFHGLPGMLVPRLMIFLAVMNGGSAVGVRGHFVENPQLAGENLS